MKTKNLIFQSFIAITFSCFIIVSCKKKEEPAPTPDPVATDGTAQQSLRASDQSNVQDESNQVMDDANSAMGGVSTTRGVQAYCNMTIDSSQKAIGKITLNYTGNNCSNTKSRTGSIVIQLPYNNVTNHVTRWSAIGANATLTFNNFKVTYLANNKSIKFNGTYSMTNTTGGGLIQLYLGNSIVYKTRANMTLSFDDSTNCNWKAAEQITYSHAPTDSLYAASISGDTIVNGHNHVAFWGTNRLGEQFTIDMPTAFSYNIYGSPCLYKPLTGVFEYYRTTHLLTLTYGVDANGTVVTSGCPYGYKFSWTDAQGATQQIVKPYY